LPLNTRLRHSKVKAQDLRYSTTLDMNSLNFTKS